MTESIDGPAVFAARLRRREALTGTVLTVPSVALAELTATPFDFVWIDLEHGALGPADVQPLAVAARAAGSAALVRLPSPGATALDALLDAGVEGVVAPRVASASEAIELVEALHHPPRGSRGFAARRAQGYGRDGPAGPRNPVCLIQVESPAAVEAAAEIAAVDGVEALVVGCADLALALGEGLELAAAPVREAITEVQLAATGAGIASGIAGPDDARLLAELGGGRSSLFVYSADVRMFARAVDAGVAGLQRELALHAPQQEESHVST